MNLSGLNSGKNLEKASSSTANNCNKNNGSINVTGCKRKRTSVTKIPLKKSAPENANTPTPFECILNEIEAFDSVNRKRDSNRGKRDPKSDADSPLSYSKQIPLSTSPPNTSAKTLTKSELARSEEDTTMLRTFLHKDGLMERILGYKMMRGRVESCATIQAIVDLEDCVSPEYEDVEELDGLNVKRPAVPYRDVPSPPPAPMHATQTPASSDKMTPTPFGAALSSEQPPGMLRRGPKTPPGSPPRAANRSRSPSICSSTSSAPRFQIDENAMASAISDDETGGGGVCSPKKPRLNSAQCTPLPLPPVFSEMRNSLKQNRAASNLSSSNGDADALLRQFSEVTQTPVDQLREFIGEDLHAAMNRLDRSVLLSTLKNALKNVTLDTTPPPPVPHQKRHHVERQQQPQHQHHQHQHRQQQQRFGNETELDGRGRNASTGEACEMEISSEQSNERLSGGASSQLLPPPPPPVISPPPPPPPLFPAAVGKASTSSVGSSTAHPSFQMLNTLPTVNLCVPPPPIMVNLSVPPPPMMLGGGLEPIRDNLPLSAANTAVPAFGSASNTSPTMHTISTNNVTTMQASPHVIRVDLTQQQNRSSIIAPLTPISINNNINSTASGVSHEAPPPTKIVVNLSEKLKNLQPISANTPGVASSQGVRPPPLQRTRPAPTVNMEFIKSRPPPPIPEILRKNIVVPAEGVACTTATPPPPIAPPPIAPLIPTTADSAQTSFATKPVTISKVDLTKLVSVQPLQPVPRMALPPQNVLCATTSTEPPPNFVPGIPPLGFKSAGDSSSRPTSRMSGSFHTSVPDLPNVHTPPPMKIAPIHRPKELLQANFSTPNDNALKSSTSVFHGSLHKQPLLPSPSLLLAGTDGREAGPRKPLNAPTSESNIFKTLMSALSSKAAAAALAQALPKNTSPAPHTQLPFQKLQHPPPTLSTSLQQQPQQQQQQLQPSMESILSSMLAGSNSTPKFNFANLSQQDLNASIATFVRALTSGAANAKNSPPRFAPRNPHFRPPRPS